MTEQANMLSPEEIKDTTQLQFTSLCNFMNALDYEPIYGITGIQYFESEAYHNRGRSVVSFHSAVQWHNGTLYDLYNSHVKFDAYRLKKAFYSKIITTVNLQKGRKSGFIMPTSKFVQFLYPEYYYMWISSKHFPF